MPGQDIGSSPPPVGQGPTPDSVPQGVPVAEATPSPTPTQPSPAPTPASGAVQPSPVQPQPATPVSPSSVPSEPPISPDDLTKAAEQIEKQADTAAGQSIESGIPGQGPQVPGAPEK